MRMLSVSCGAVVRQFSGVFACEFCGRPPPIWLICLVKWYARDWDLTFLSSHSFPKKKRVNLILFILRKPRLEMSPTLG